MQTFFLKIFRFDAKTDYLPYFTNEEATVKLENSLKSLLKKILPNEAMPKYGVNIGGLAVDINAPLKEIYEKFGESFTVMPLSTKRAVKDLAIESEDFISRFKILEPFVKDEDFKSYEELALYHYASPALKYDEEIYGTAFYIFASKMAQKYPEYEKEIVQIVSDEKKGVYNHISLRPHLFEFDDESCGFITFLKDKVRKYFPKKVAFEKEIEEESGSLLTLLNLTENDIPSKLPSLKYSFDKFNAAIFLGENSELSGFEKEIIKFSNLNTKYLPKHRHNSGMKVFDNNKKLAFLIAGEILLEALDSGVDFMLIRNKRDLELLDRAQKECAKAVGRDINLPVLTFEELLFIAIGKIDDSGIKNHKIVPNFLPI